MRRVSERPTVVSQTGRLRGRPAFQCAAPQAQVVMALEELLVRLERRPALGETARLAV